MRKTIIALMLVAAFASTTAVYAISNYQDITSAIVHSNANALNIANIRVADTIPSPIAYGYGVLTDSRSGSTVAIVTTTHPGVLDSEDQSDASDGVWHNHVVALTGSDVCRSGLEVVDLTFESPGVTSVHNTVANIANVPLQSYNGQLSGLTISPGRVSETVVSFGLEPHFDRDGHLTNVCVNVDDKIRAGP